jgi:putative hydrolase of the HAD superfamily
MGIKKYNLKIPDKPLIKAICFDLGDTLFYNPGMPLSWAKNYKNALKIGFEKINKTFTENNFAECIKILTKYNTRTNPREIEYNSDKIFTEIMEYLKINSLEKSIIENEFFNFFHEKLVLFPDTEKVLSDIKKLDLKIGILTDAPYGMPNKFVFDVMKPIDKYIDIMLSSVDVGYRKPNSKGYELLAKELNVNVHEMIYIGNEEKDIIGANNMGIMSILINRTKEKIDFGENYQFENLESMWKKIKEEMMIV